MIIKALLKNAVLKVLRKVSAYRHAFYIPKGEISLNQLGPEIKMIFNRSYDTVKRDAPLTIGSDIYWKFKQIMTDRPANNFLIEVKGWRVWGNQGAVITNDGYLLKEVSREFEKPDHSVFKQLKLTVPSFLNGTSAVITASGANMYYHWMFDILPRLKIISDHYSDNAIDHYIIDYRGVAYQTESLKTLKIDPDKISKATDHFKYHITAENLLIPSLPSNLDVVSGQACRFLIDTFLNKQLPSKYGRKIYLKRTDKRKLINEHEIELYLKEKGFELVQCENHTIAEQASIFYNADIIIGPHGAAFTNIVFCKPGSKVLEFFSPKWINPCYWSISNEIDLEYYYLIGEGAPPDEFSDAKGTMADIQLNLKKLKMLCEQYKIFNSAQ